LLRVVRHVAIPLAAICMLGVVAAPAQGQSSYHRVVLDGEWTDFIVGPRNRTFDTFTVYGTPTAINLVQDAPWYWTVMMEPPVGETFNVGTFDTYSLPQPGTLKLTVDGEGRGCSGLAGHITISDLAFDTTGHLTRLAAQFDLLCPGGGHGGFFGAVAIGVPTPPPSHDLSARVLDFGKVAIGPATPAQSFELRNIGTVPLPVTIVGLTGDTGSFQVVSDACTGSTLHADETCTVAVRAVRSEAGSATARLGFRDPLTNGAVESVVLYAEGDPNPPPTTTSTTPTSTTTTTRPVSPTTTNPTTTNPTTTNPTTTTPTTTTRPPVLDASGAFHPLDPTRVFDSRGGRPFAPGETRQVPVTALLGLAGGDVGAVALNITATQPSANSYVTVFPDGAALPSTSNVNFLADQNVANMALVGVGPTGAVSVHNGAGTTHVIIDVIGWFSSSTGRPGSSYHPVLPQRWFDTRTDARGDGSIHPVGPADTVITSFTQLRPTSSAHMVAVALNVTATNTTSASYLTVFPPGRFGETSSVNWASGETVPNAVITKLEPSLGLVAFANDTGNVDVLVDINGYFDDGQPSSPSSPGFRFRSFAPRRIVDTRSGIVPAGSFSPNSFNLGPGESRVVRAVGGPVDEAAVAVAVNITVDARTSSGYLNMYPLGLDPALGTRTSTLNFVAGRAVANAAIATVGIDGQLVITNNSAGYVELLVDLSGEFS
jgi:hypothetical protein